MDALVKRVAFCFRQAKSNLWQTAVGELEVFNKAYEEVHQLYEADNTGGLERMLNHFAFVRNGTAPTVSGTGFIEWMKQAFVPGEVPDPESVRPLGPDILAVIEGTREIGDFFKDLDAYRDAMQAVVNAAGPVEFRYEGFKIVNRQRLGDTVCRKMLEGVDYVGALFKKRGLSPLLKEGVSRVELVPEIDEGSNTLGLYWGEAKTITLSKHLVDRGEGRFMKWVNEAFLHEFGHHVHLSFLAGGAKKEWDSGWVEVEDKKKAFALAFEKITHDERVKFFHLLYDVGFEPAKAAKKLDSVQKVKFGIWLRTPMVGDALITPKQFKLTKDGLYVASFFRNPFEFIKANYGLDDPESPEFKRQNETITKRMSSKLGLGYANDYPIPSSTVEELAKSDPEMQKAVEDALDKLEIVSPYGRKNEKEDFAETFVAFVGAPEKLTPTAKFRMQRALSLSGLYGKEVMKLAQAAVDPLMPPA